MRYVPGHIEEALYLVGSGAAMVGLVLHEALHDWRRKHPRRRKR